MPESESVTMTDDYNKHLYAGGISHAEAVRLFHLAQAKGWITAPAPPPAPPHPHALRVLQAKTILKEPSHDADAQLHAPAAPGDA